MDAAAELGRNPVSKHQIQPEYGYEQADADGITEPVSRATKFSGANADREMLILPVQLATSRIGNLTRLIHALAICVTIHSYYSTVLVPTCCVVLLQQLQIPYKYLDESKSRLSQINKINKNMLIGGRFR